jgi:Cu(I)/Ag(I) efflux system membrane fusion protein
VRALGDGRFQPVDVVTGMRAGGMVEIFNGLEPATRSWSRGSS